jgi:peptidoglycan/xylan/chitin deacetylase (PgdA/CDA1 family)
VSARARLKAAVEALAVLSGAVRVARARRAGDALVLAYHNVVPDQAPAAGDASLHLRASTFAAHLDELAATHDVVPLDALLGPRDPGRRPLAAITFDDAYRGAVTLGLAALVARSLPATVFVAPAFVGGGTFWWDAVSAPGRALDPAARRHALEELGGDDARVRDWWRAEGRVLAAVPDHMRCASADELDAAVGLPGVTIGSHSWSHPNLARLAATELAHELTASRRWIEERFPGRARPLLAYPYGRTAPHVAAAAAAAGYRAALRVEGGWMGGADADPYALPRLNVPAGLSARGFALRASGLLS